MTKFERVAPWAMDKLMADFGFSLLGAAAIMGNAGHESGGLEKLQEINPTVKGSRGGYGWFQWTGPRRREYEAYCERNGFDPASDIANYKFLFVELKSTEKKAIAAVKNARTLDEKTVAFEKAFERAGIKHYPSRKQWALKALHAWEAHHEAGGKIEDPKEPEPPVITPPKIPVGASEMPFAIFMLGVGFAGGLALASGTTIGQEWGDALIALGSTTVLAGIAWVKEKLQ